MEINIEKRALLRDFSLEIISTKDWQKFYENCTEFNTYSEKRFLSSVKIPATYYLSQDDNVQEELRLKQTEIISESKLANQHILILKRNNIIENCVRIDYSKAIDLLERIKLQDESKLTSVRDFIKDGYSSNFTSLNKLEKGKYNIGVFVDIPILALDKKLPVVHYGFYYVPKEGEEYYKSLYLESIEMNISDYHDLDLLIEDSLKEVKKLSEKDIFEKLKEKLLLRELDDILVNLVKEKVISKAISRGISKFVDKNDIQVNSVYDLLDLLLKYDSNMKNYKTTTSLRSCKFTLDKILTGKTDSDA